MPIFGLVLTVFNCLGCVFPFFLGALDVVSYAAHRSSGPKKIEYASHSFQQELLIGLLYLFGIECVVDHFFLIGVDVGSDSV